MSEQNEDSSTVTWISRSDCADVWDKLHITETDPGNFDLVWNDAEPSSDGNHPSVINKASVATQTDDFTDTQQTNTTVFFKPNGTNCFKCWELNLDDSNREIVERYCPNCNEAIFVCSLHSKSYSPHGTDCCLPGQRVNSR